MEARDWCTQQSGVLNGPAQDGPADPSLPGLPTLDAIRASLTEVSNAAVPASDTFSFREAADFAGRIEQISRTLDYLQLVAARAVDRTRRQASLRTTPGAEGGNGSWTTGWRDVPAAGADGNGTPGPTAPAGPAPFQTAAGAGTAATATADTAADDGYRNTVEFLRARLRISAAEARRRLALSDDVLPRTILAGQVQAPRREALGAAMATAKVPARNAGIVAAALDRVQGIADPDSLLRMESALTRTAEESDPDFLTRIARRWTDAIDQDGAEPTEELLRRLQGAFIRKSRHGLNHLEIFATPDQFEHLVTVMNTATNPRSQSDDAAELDRRSRPQKLLDGLVGACKVALASGTLPATGGLRPQVMVTIDYRDLLSRLLTAGAGTEPGLGSAAPWTGPWASGLKHAAMRTEQGSSRPELTGSMLFGGPVNASTIRKLACDADIIPLVLGGEGQILDIGRASRVFPPHVRKAITVRDGGCAFPGCTMPAPWCEAHHINYWSQGGSTGTDNGTLLCSFHHHLIHKEQWAIQVREKIPWFIPPPHVDPRRKPRRNSYFRPPALTPAA